MKISEMALWKNVQSEVRWTEALLGGVSKLREMTANPTTVRNILRGRTAANYGPVSYSLKPGFIKTFATASVPFLTYYEFNDLTGWYRDNYFAPEHVDDYADDIGQAYTVWTHEATSIYRRHVFPDALKQNLTVSFEIPNLESASWFPLRIRLYDHEGLYFQNDQKLVVDRLSEGKPTLTSWKKIPQLEESLVRLHARTA